MARHRYRRSAVARGCAATLHLELPPLSCPWVARLVNLTLPLRSQLKVMHGRFRMRRFRKKGEDQTVASPALIMRFQGRTASPHLQYEAASFPRTRSYRLVKDGSQMMVRFLRVARHIDARIWLT